MASTGVNPIILAAAGDTFVGSCRIAGIVWEGATTSGDLVVLSRRVSPNDVLWKARTDTTVTYLGIVLDKGIPCDGGFTLSQCSSGTVYVYLQET